MRSLLLLPFLLGFSVPVFAHNAANGGTEYPNGWSQVGKECYEDGNVIGPTYTKLQKNSDNSLYGVWKGYWIIKDVTLVLANQEMNNKCATNSYQPTS